MQLLVYYRLNLIVRSWFTFHLLYCIRVRGCCIKTRGPLGGLDKSLEQFLDSNCAAVLSVEIKYAVVKR